MDNESLWCNATSEDIERVELGNAALGNLKRCESIERWLEAGTMFVVIREEAKRATNTDKGTRYNAAWKALAAERAQHAFDIDKTTRSQAMWMATNWEEINDWRTSLPVHDRMKLIHPGKVYVEYRKANQEQTERPPRLPKPAKQERSLRELLAERPLADLVGLLRQVFASPEKRLELVAKLRATAMVDHMRALIDATGRSQDERDLRIIAAGAKLPKDEDRAALLASVADAAASVTDADIAEMKRAVEIEQYEREQAAIDEMQRQASKWRAERKAKQATAASAPKRRKVALPPQPGA